MADKIVSWGGIESKSTDGMGITGSLRILNTNTSSSVLLDISGSTNNSFTFRSNPLLDAGQNGLRVNVSAAGYDANSSRVAYNFQVGGTSYFTIANYGLATFSQGIESKTMLLQYNPSSGTTLRVYAQGASGNAIETGGSEGTVHLGSNTVNTKVNEILRITGKGATSSTTALLVQNANASASFQVKDNSEVVFATPDYTPTDGNNPFSYLSKTRVGIYVAVAGNNTGISYEGGQIYANIGYGLSNPKFTPTGNNQWVTNANFTSQGNIIANNFYLGTNGGYFSAPSTGTDLYAVFAGSTSASGQGRILMYGETHAPKKGKLELYSGTDPLYGVISFLPGNTEAARFTPDGRLNIGAITGSAKLLISGSSNSVLLEIDSPAVNNILYVSGSGNVGIGTSVPSASLHVSGAILNYPINLPTASGTASMDCSKSNFFNLTLSGSYTLFLSASNIQPGQTINLRVIQPATSGSLNYGSQFKFAGGIPYSASATSSTVDIISFISYDTAVLYGSAIKNLS
jgi:hypothetical protein